MKFVSPFVNSKKCITFLLVRLKDLLSLVMRVTSVEFIYLRYVKECDLKNIQITNVMSPTLYRPKLEFYSAKIHASNATFEALIVGHYLEKHLI